ncbi:unnamed protein product [Notodromas monacha]|uniref:Sushi domain-containing protein n=1 Tax=Notodromas monacha TaxID=399045 RepID=A0A7R9BLX3_9CRUS|nr:unnamed protein product [Notodromas monacha]CAG0917922.1 unnamed protein product [Notodromas monacha]
MNQHLIRSSIVLGILMACALAAGENADCEQVLQAQKQGYISADDFEKNPLCRRVFISRGDEKLSFSFIRVEMAEKEKLVLEFNGERHELGPDTSCELCLPKVVTSKLSIALVPVRRLNASTANPPSSQAVREKSLDEVMRSPNLTIDIHDVMINDVNFAFERVESKFTILYQTFDPYACPAPSLLSLPNGYVKGKDSKIGAEIEFKCKVPFDPVGATKARCIVSEGIPQWSAEQPKCLIKCDPGKFLVRKVTRIRPPGALPALSNPGYEVNSVSGGSEVCKWELRAPEGSFVQLRIHYVDLPNLGDDLSFLSVKSESTKDPILLTGVVPPRNLTVPAARVWVEYYGPRETFSSRLGFYVTYSARPSFSCSLPKVNGMIYVEDQGSDADVVATVSCAPRFSLPPEATGAVACYENGTWESEFPECLLNEVAEGEAEDGVVGQVVADGSGLWNGTSDFQPGDNYPSFLDDFEENETSVGNHVNSSTQNTNATDIVNVFEVVIVDKDSEDSSSSNPFLVGGVDFRNTRVLGLPLWLVVVVAAGAGILVILVCVSVIVVVFVSRRRYPGVGSGGPLGLGRKFDTFENPIYSRVNLRPPPTLSSYGNGLSPDDSKASPVLTKSPKVNGLFSEVFTADRGPVFDVTQCRIYLSTTRPHVHDMVRDTAVTEKLTGTSDDDSGDDDTKDNACKCH